MKARVLVKLENNNWWVATKEDTVKWQEATKTHQQNRAKGWEQTIQNTNHLNNLKMWLYNKVRRKEMEKTK